MAEESLTLAQAQQTVDEWIRTYGVRYFSELTNMACLTEAFRRNLEKKTSRDATRHLNNPKLQNNS